MGTLLRRHRKPEGKNKSFFVTSLIETISRIVRVIHLQGVFKTIYGWRKEERRIHYTDNGYLTVMIDDLRIINATHPLAG